LSRLSETFKNYQPPVIVSSPLRVTPIVTEVKELLKNDVIGPIHHIVAFNDVPYGRIYYNSWYRNYDEMGGLFLQKATHDFDVMRFLLEQDPYLICAMNSRRVYGGKMPHDLRCRNCDKIYSCPESVFNLYYETFEFESVDLAREDDWCVFSQDIKSEDSGNAIIEYKNGVQASYTQNFFARHDAARRGARLYGPKGTIEFDWYKNCIKIFSHRTPSTSNINFNFPNNEHFCGDRELCFDFLMAMKDKRPPRSSLRDGIVSVLTCLWARNAAEKRQFCEVKMP